MKYTAPGRYNDQYDGKYVGAIGDRSGDDDPAFVQINEDHFHWIEKQMIAVWFSSHTNRTTFFPAAANQMAPDTD